MYLGNLNFLFKKNSKRAELLTKASFFLYFRDRPKNGERNIVEVTKHQKRWRKLKLI